MKNIILQASDRDQMIIKGPAVDDNPWGVDIQKVTAVFMDCLALIRRENQEVVIFNLIYTVNSAHKVELYYSIRGKHEISPMGIIGCSYESLEQFKVHMHEDFSDLEFPT